MPCTSAIAFPRETEVNDDSKIVIFLAMTGAAVLTIMAAESLTRKAFGGHIQLWKIWTREVAASPAVLGRTVVGYLLVGIFFAYEVALYFFANEKLGWWVPSGALFDPDILATYFPFYHGLSISLWAGLWEECLYRAVPLAAAALLGTRFGGRRYWILGTLFFQAVLFGASHANYPMQPAYARIVEMTLLFMLVGVLFLVFGLLPVIVMHFVFDSVWFALPLFASSAPGIWINRSLIIVLTLVPLWVALYARWRHGRWGEVADNALNRAWMPPPPPERPAMPGTVVLSAGLGRRTQLALAGMGLVGIALWIGASSFTGETPTFKADRTRTMRAARHALEQHGITLDDSWRELASVDGQVDWRDRFVWQEGGAKTYRNLFGSYLQPPRWYVRYACFEGDVAERAEEYGIWVDGEGKVRRFKHTLPEARAGESLDENAAHALAHEAIAKLHGLDPKGLEEVSAEPDKQPARRDWELVFKNPSVKAGGGGEARVSVRIAGDDVVDSFMFVHVPEKWRRNESARLTTAWIVTFGMTAVMVLLFVAGGVMAIVRWSRGRFATRTFLTFLFILAGLWILALINDWPATPAGFQTQMAFGLQAARALGLKGAGMLALAAGTALNIGLVHRLLPIQPRASSGVAFTGVALGTALAGLAALASAMSPDTAPLWADVQNAGTIVPLIAIVATPVADWMVRVTLLLLVLGVVHAATSGWTRRRVPLGAVILLVGLVLAGSHDVETISVWLGSGLASGIALLAAYVLILRFHLALVPVALAVMAALGVLREGLMRGTPLAFPGAMLAVVLLLVLGHVWMRWLTLDSAQSPTNVEKP